MNAPTAQHPQAWLLRLRHAIGRGDAEAICNALPEAPTFLATVFSLEPAERKYIFAGVLAALPTEEDQWEMIEAAAMDSIVRPERGALAAIVPYIPAALVDDARALVAQLPSPQAAREVKQALDKRPA